MTWDEEQSSSGIIVSWKFGLIEPRDQDVTKK